jgi:hypothetical protein
MIEEAISVSSYISSLMLFNIPDPESIELKGVFVIIRHITQFNGKICFYLADNIHNEEAM